MWCVLAVLAPSLSPVGSPVVAQDSEVLCFDVRQHHMPRIQRDDVLEGAAAQFVIVCAKPRHALSLTAAFFWRQVNMLTPIILSTFLGFTVFLIGTDDIEKRLSAASAPGQIVNHKLNIRWTCKGILRRARLPHGLLVCNDVFGKRVGKATAAPV